MVEFYTKAAGKRVAVSVQLKGDDKTYTSHRNSILWAGSAAGWNRVGVEMPHPVSQSEIARVDVVGVGPGSAIVSEVRKVMTLSAEFEPQILPITWHGDIKLGGGADRVPAYVD
jgi:DNA-directed RNA polymerase subunit L